LHRNATSTSAKHCTDVETHNLAALTNTNLKQTRFSTTAAAASRRSRRCTRRDCCRKLRRRRR
tara:strand:+ start:1660 stop:1848 length:189 start_codon:yes stop_codon:yes gene_type:complete